MSNTIDFGCVTPTPEISEKKPENSVLLGKNQDFSKWPFSLDMLFSRANLDKLLQNIAHTADRAKSNHAGTDQTNNERFKS